MSSISQRKRGDMTQVIAETATSQPYKRLETRSPWNISSIVRL